MRENPLNSLRFQIAVGFVLMVVGFACASLYTLAAFQRQVDFDALVDIAGRLELTAQQMHTQAMRYERNAPRDYPSYYRDLRLHYQDLMGQIELFDRVVDGFMRGDFGAPMEGQNAWPAGAGRLRLAEASPLVLAAIRRLEDAWGAHRFGLMEALGQDPDEPRLEWAAEHNIAGLGAIEAESARLTQALRDWARAEHRRVGWVALTLTAAAVLLAVLVLAALQLGVLGPMRRSIEAVHRISGGDFGHRLPASGSRELRALAASVDGLSARLDLLFRLIGELQRGRDLDDLLALIARDFRVLLRFDWIGVLLVDAQETTAWLDAAWMDGAREGGQRRPFPLSGTLLARALAEDRPLHIEAMTATAATNPSYVFLGSLCERGLEDAIFLPVTARTQTPVPAVIAFANRNAGSYDEAHMRFLGNIAQLLTESFGRTVRLAEHGRLAAIGELASGIAHEMRSPLGTVGMALDWLDRQPQPDKARRRLALATQETARMARLMDDMLLYAKPIRLEPERVSVSALAAELNELIDGHPRCRGHTVVVDAVTSSDEVMRDPDRWRQIVTNLLANACEASASGEPIRVKLGEDIRDEHQRWVWLEIANRGEPFPTALLGRVGEPFITTKQGGTGLGLAIVSRLIRLHAGALEIVSSREQGTLVRVLLPIEREQPGERVKLPAMDRRQ